MASRRAMGMVAAICVALGLANRGWAQGPAVTGAPPQQIGQRISLDLKGVDILDVLKLLSQKSGLNFIAGRNLSGRVTIFVNDVDVWEAFELIIAANDLAYERKGTIVTVMMGRDYELLYGERFQGRTESFVTLLRHAKVEQVATVLNQLKSSIGRVIVDEATNTLIIEDIPARVAGMRTLLTQLDRPTESRVYALNYSDAEKLKEKVQTHLSPIGTLTFDARTNKVVVSDLPEAMRKIDEMILAFDSPEGQVLIEAKIVKVELNDQMDLGIDWKQVFSADLEARSNFRLLSDIVGGTATGGAMKLFTASNDKTQIIIEALKKLTKTETLSNPRILVSNNQEAKILVGKKEAVVTVTTTVPATGSTVSSPEIQYVDVGTKLFVTPNIKPNGHIQLKVRPEVSTSTIETFQTNRIPIITSTEAETNVLVKSGVTLVIGGLIETKDEQKHQRIPVLSDLPVIGMLFRSTSTVKTKTELVLFLTPQIIGPDGSTTPVPAAVEPSVDVTFPVVTLTEPVPVSYRHVIRQRLQGRLISQFRAAALPAGSVVLSFVLSHDGALVEAPEVTSPQGQPFILAAQQAVQQAQPFPPFPAGSQATEVRFRVAVDYVP
ncbi:MAG: secretin N-terminal domain-containing protein [Candidatus Omnitrophota bacterium]|nr:secretin N-terminal domain-containing protein [Candidatus Omnitrophota bacterium]